MTYMAERRNRGRGRGIAERAFRTLAAALPLVFCCVFFFPARAQDIPALPTIEEMHDRGQVEKGVQAYQAERYLEAATIFEKFLLKHPGSHEIHFALGLCHLQLGRYGTAVWNLEKSLEGKPDRKEAYLGLAKAYLGQDDYARSAGALENYVRLQPNVDAMIAFSLAKLYFQMGKYSQAEELFGALKKKSPETADFWFGYAVTLTQTGRWKEALAAFEKTAALNPAQDQIGYYIGIAAYQSGDFKRAGPLIEKELEKNPGSGSLLTAMGVIAGNNKEYGKAEKYIRRGIAVEPGDVRSYINLVAVLAQGGKVDEAMKEAEAALKRWPDNEELLYSFAVILINKEKMSEATGAVEKIVRINPGNMDARRLLASLYQNRLKNSPAIEQYRAIIAKEPGDAESRKSLAVLLRKEEKYEEALNHYKYLIKQDPKDEDSWRKAALLLEKLEKKDELTKHYGKMAEALPKSGFAYANLGYMAEEAGDRRKALAFYEKALAREDVGDVGVYVKRAKYYEEEGAGVSAEIMYRRGLEKTLEHSQEVYKELMKDLQETGGRLDLNKLMEIGEKEEHLDDSLTGSMDGVMKAFEAREDRTGAISYLEGLIEKYPGNKELIKRVGGLEREAGNIDRVQLFSNQLIKADVKDGAGHLWMAWVMETKGDTAGAGLSYMRAVETDPENEEACRGLVESYTKQGRLAFLESFLRRKLKKNMDLKPLRAAYTAAAAAAGISPDMQLQFPEIGETPEE